MPNTACCKAGYYDRKVVSYHRLVCNAVLGAFRPCFANMQTLFYKQYTRLADVVVEDCELSDVDTGSTAVYVVTEAMETDLSRVIASAQTLSEDVVRYIMYQVRMHAHIVCAHACTVRCGH